jgi:hypothetical protein
MIWNIVSKRVAYEPPSLLSPFNEKGYQPAAPQFCELLFLYHLPSIISQCEHSPFFFFALQFIVR